MPPTPLHALPALAAELGVGAIHVKDEGFRLGLGSFKALGGAYAVIRLVLEEACAAARPRRRRRRRCTPEVRAVAAGMTFACATDGNHGRSVAQGAQLVGARAVIFVHGGVSDERVAAIARFGAEMIRVAGTYDDSVPEAARVAAEKGWTVVSDTSWPGYERIPGLVMQGYTAMVREALRRARRSRRPMSSCRPASAASRPPSRAILRSCSATGVRPSSWSSRRAPPASSRPPRPGIR